MVTLRHYLVAWVCKKEKNFGDDFYFSNIKHFTFKSCLSVGSDYTTLAGSTLYSVNDEMNRLSPQAIKITNSFFDFQVFIRDENIFW